MKILGVNDHHNSSVSLLIDGKLVCAMQEERFSRKKNFWGTPIRSVNEALKFAGISLDDIDIIAFAGQRHSGHVDFSREQHLEILKRMVQMDLIDTLRGQTSVNVSEILKRKLLSASKKLFSNYFTQRELKKMKAERLDLFFKNFPTAKNKDIHFIDHHQCHFATAHYGAGKPTKDRLVFTNDGQGDFRCGSVSKVSPSGQSDTLCSIEDRDSIGQIWALITLLMGFVPLEHEYKLMGMAPYSSESRKKQVSELIEGLYQWKNGFYQLKDRKGVHSYYIQKQVNDLEKVMKFQRFDDICGGLQEFTEKALCQWVSYWINETGIKDICLSGGTFMNVKANLALMNLPEVENVFVFPSCGDETNAIGACYQAYYDKTGNYPEPLQSFYLGKEWSREEIETSLKEIEGEGLKISYHENIEENVAQLLAQGEVVARFKGREEFGARALGNRSILANPGKWAVVSEINDMIKQRDFWMPFACSMLEEDHQRYIKNSHKNCGRYMIMAFNGADEIGEIVAGTHPRDKTVRPQIVNKDQAPDYHKLIQSFKKNTGIAAVLNTSFNLHGFPLVHSPDDAIHVLKKSGLKNLALGNFLIQKS